MNTSGKYLFGFLIIFGIVHLIIRRGTLKEILTAFLDEAKRR